MSYLRPARNLHVPLADGHQRGLEHFLVPAILFMSAGTLLLVSMFLPYWGMTLEAPQYPDGLAVDVYVDHLEGDVGEIDALNHYLGLPPLEEGGTFERQIAIPSIIGFSVLLVAAIFVAPRLAIPAALPTITFPVIFLADLRYILYTYGQSVDPESALGGAIDPFTPPLFGEGLIGQFRTVAVAGPGLWLAFIAVALTIAGLVLHHRVYRIDHAVSVDDVTDTTTGTKVATPSEAIRPGRGTDTTDRTHARPEVN